MDDRDWERLIAQLRRGDCTPFLGAGACGTLPIGADMSRRWAAAYDYPFTDDGDLARVMQYAAVLVGDQVDLKQRVCADIKSANTPDFSDPAEPHALLAEFPIPVFLTTNYDDFLLQALARIGKNPSAATCSWFEGAAYDKELFEVTPAAKPTEERPLIYHLHGRVQTPKSLVLTESDYLEFLVRITSSRADQALDIIPATIFAALTDNPLLFIGYSLQDWTFKVLFHGLIRSIPGIHRRRNVSVQLLPPVRQSRKEAEERARDFMIRYFEGWSISIFWGTAREFCQELRQRIGVVP